MWWQGLSLDCTFFNLLTILIHFKYLKKSTIRFGFFFIFFRQTFIKQTPNRHAIKKKAIHAEKSSNTALVLSDLFATLATSDTLSNMDYRNAAV